MSRIEQFRQLQQDAAAAPSTPAEMDRLRRLQRVATDLRVSTEACLEAVHARVERIANVLTASQMVPVSYTHLTLPTNREV